VNIKTPNIRKDSAFSLVELMVGAVIFLAITIGAYAVYTATTRRATESQQEAKLSRELRQFFERFRHQIENTLQLPNAEGTQLKVARPSRCIISSTDPDTEIGWSLIAYPGRTYDTIPMNFTATEPSAYFDESSKPNDAIRMVYATEDSVVNYLKVMGTPAVAFPTIGNNPIVIDGAAKNLNVGDYAVIADAFRKDLIRVTGINIIGGNDQILHESAKSAWNAPDLGYNYGGNFGQYGQPVIFKVGIATYALDPDRKTLMKDSHFTDDDFSQDGTWNSGLKQNWEAIAPNVSKFQLVYVKADGTQTRTPQAGMPGKIYRPCTGQDDDVSNCGCGNELGNPEIKSIKLNIEYTNGSTSTSDIIATTEQFNPSVLKKGLPYFGIDNSGCNGDVLYRTNLDGSQNPDCDNPACLCTDRAPPRPCPAPCGQLVGPGGWGDGGGAG
jgi:Tfp pilus assembly protein PilE